MAEAEEEQSKKRDPGWKYCFLLDKNNPNNVTCKFCNKTTKGGICRAKQHLLGNSRNCTKCQKCPPEVKEELQAHAAEKSRKRKDAFEEFDESEFFALIDKDNEDETGAANKKGKAGKGPMDLFLTKKAKNMKQTSINDACDKELREEAVQHIARFFYQAGIAFNVAHLNSFKKMIEVVGQYGPHLKPPSYHELRVPLLKKELAYTEDLMKDHKKEWAQSGCSIMSDGWTDRNQRTLINFLVNCSKGTMFVESVDASQYVKTGDKLFELLDQFVERIGEKNIVQLITDNGSNYVMAGKLLMAKRPNMFWTPCAAHCIDLMLEDIGKIDKIKKTLARGIALVGFIYSHLVGFIYSHGGVLSMMREFTENRELARHGITRFATCFLTLQSLHMQKQGLRSMFTSTKWSQSRWAKEEKGKRATETIFMPSFWNNVAYTLKLMGPLVRVLRLVDNEKKPAMGYIYEAMDRAKEAIQKSFDGKEENYKVVFEIIDKRWDCQLHQSLHAAGYYLNPEFHYSNKDIEKDGEIKTGLFDCIKKLVQSEEDQDAIIQQLAMFKTSSSLFGSPFAIRTRAKMAPAEWWKMFGSATPQLQSLAVKILSLSCSASGCERNWSIFEHIHSKKRNRLEHKRLHELVYIKYNQTLKARYESSVVVDPISLNDIDDSNEWLIGEMDNGAAVVGASGEGGVTWQILADASGVGEGRNTRQQAKSKETRASSSTAAKAKQSLEEFQSFKLIDEMDYDIGGSDGETIMDIE